MPTTNTHKRKAKLSPTTEAGAFLDGLYTEFVLQSNKYHDLTAALLAMGARVELAEKQLCLTRDHLAMMVNKTDCPVMPHNWAATLERVRFVGYRLVDACLEVIEQKGNVSSKELLEALNVGMYRFRTNTPFREIHAALLRQTNVERTEDGWKWLGPAAQQQTLTLMRRRTRPAAS